MNRYAVNYKGFIYRGTWGLSELGRDMEISHEIQWPDGRITPFPFDNTLFPCQHDVEHFVEELLEERI